jgi:hypothetical protein
MGYSLEYKEWTGADVEADFSIKETSFSLGPEMEKEITCDGIGFIALLKGEDGQLMAKMKPEDGEPSEIVSYFDILDKYRVTTPTTPIPDGDEPEIIL